MERRSWSTDEIAVVRTLSVLRVADRERVRRDHTVRIDGWAAEDNSGEHLQVHNFDHLSAPYYVGRTETRSAAALLRSRN